MAERSERWQVDAKDVAEAEKSVAKTVEGIRAERQKRTGHLTCD
jgi:conjugal transfer/entry exclusion protein